MLNWIVKGLMQWLYGMAWQMGEYIMNALMNVFSMDMTYFKTAVPISETIMNIMFGVGWALLLGNLVFQAAKAIMSGIGFEGEDPRTLGTRTMVFAFLLVASRQICDLGLSLGAKVVQLLQIPGSVILPSLADDMFGIDASWFLMMIVGIIILFQLIKFFFEVGERYVIVGVLTILSPLAFAMGGSKNTMDIFKGWARMYGSMCLMLILNVVFMKLIISAMAIFPHGLSVFPWLILIIALARVARKIDNIIARIGLNPAITGDGLGRGFPGMMAMMVGRSLISGAMNGKFGAGKAAASAATSAASGAAAGAAARGAGFAGGARPAPSPVNTNAASGNNASSRTTGTDFTGNTNTATAGTNPVSGTPVNPPVGRTGASPQGNPNRSAGTSPFSKPVHSPANGRGTPARNGIAVSADDVPTRQTAGDGSIVKPPQASRMNTAETSKPMDTSMGAGVQEKPSRPPRGSGDMKPLEVSGDNTRNNTLAGGNNAMSSSPVPLNTASQQPQAQHDANAGTPGRSTSIQNGGVSPVQTSQSTQQGARAQVNAATSQGGTQVQSNTHTSQQGAQVQQSGGQVQQNVQQNTQNQTRTGSSPQPVSTQAVGGASAGKNPAASHQQAASAPTPTSTATAGKTTAKTQTAKPAQKSSSGAAAQTPKTTPKPLELQKQGKQPKVKQESPKTAPKISGKNQPPAPLDIGTEQRDAAPNVAAGGTGEESTANNIAVTDNEQ